MATVVQLSASLSGTMSLVLYIATVASCLPFCQGQCPHFCTWPQWPAVCHSVRDSVLISAHGHSGAAVCHSVRDNVLSPVHSHSGQLSAILSGTVSCILHMATVVQLSAILSGTMSLVLYIATVASCLPFCQGQCPASCTWPQWCSCLPFCQGQCP